MNLFDTGLHPTLNGEWLDGRRGLTFGDVDRLLQTEEMMGACALGVPGVGDYEHAAFYEAAREVRRLFPVAAITDRDPERWGTEVGDVASIGYRGVHFHPRALGVNHTPDAVETILRHCFEEELILFYCTFYATQPTSMPNNDPLWDMVRAIKQTPEAVVVLVHGGGHRLLEYAETFRYFPNVLIDLSFTLTRYLNSSIKSDILHVLRTMDQRVCLGSDSPDVPWKAWKEEVEALQQEIEPTKWFRITQGNASRLFPEFDS